MEEKVEPTKSVSAVDALVTSERIAEPRLTLMEDPRNLHPKEKVLEVARTKIQKQYKMCHWGPSFLGFFEVGSDHGDTVEDDIDVDESSE